MTGESQKELSRRTLLRGAAVTSAGWLCGFEKILGSGSVQAEGALRVPNGKIVGVVPFTGEARVPMGEAFGGELDGRLYTDLGLLDATNLLTSNEQFYLRTRASSLLPDSKGWAVRIGGQSRKPVEISVAALREIAKPMGRHLMECAGNARSAHFGMMSVADWTGVPVVDVLDRAKPDAQPTRILISGFDTYSAPSASSIPGASWVFTREDLEKAGAFLATEINGDSLTRDHGAPVRLLVPGWYGCACIKWVNEMSFAAEDVAATSQMQEYAARTMQTGARKLAREFKPAVIDPAAMPVRIEKWVVQDKIQYRVVGLLWGGSTPVKRLQIRFNPEEEYVDLDELSEGNTQVWRLWTHVWKPSRPGSYFIRLHVAEPAVVARRLDSGYYMRSVDISEV